MDLFTYEIPALKVLLAAVVIFILLLQWVQNHGGHGQAGCVLVVGHVGFSV